MAHAARMCPARHCLRPGRPTGPPGGPRNTSNGRHCTDPGTGTTDDHEVEKRFGRACIGVRSCDVHRGARQTGVSPRSGNLGGRGRPGVAHLRGSRAEAQTVPDAAGEPGDPGEVPYVVPVLVGGRMEQAGGRPQTCPARRGTPSRTSAASTTTAACSGPCHQMAVSMFLGSGREGALIIGISENSSLLINAPPLSAFLCHCLTRSCVMKL